MTSAPSCTCTASPTPSTCDSLAINRSDQCHYCASLLSTKSASVYSYQRVPFVNQHILTLVCICGLGGKLQNERPWHSLTWTTRAQLATSSVVSNQTCCQPTSLPQHKIGSSPACNFPAVVGDHPHAHLQTERNYPPQRPVGCLGPGWCTYQNRGPPLCSLCHKAHDDSQRIPEICVVPWHVLPDSIPQGCLGEPRHGHVARRHC